MYSNDDTLSHREAKKVLGLKLAFMSFTVAWLQSSNLPPLRAKSTARKIISFAETSGIPRDEFNCALLALTGGLLEEVCDELRTTIKNHDRKVVDQLLADLNDDDNNPHRKKSP